ncbi:hypothetical protein CMQ_3359 [Grosmannia clavigera kw1407]|uniref:Uncharacterized protein n=1 Tax=Grosmannia clavigera (strain kw1407 / UAMH 11150) TaxID=655863 RepID=F0X9L8_GROCL|nr:uncharacterized protein CMQ_3359 [Grosmannia clavigera kw1407]EFX05290.1 hypothetical protein CMQ_3359 [Grosmannia clavigera kw1407]
MFLHSGASLHGHEYSNKKPDQHSQPRPRRSPLLRSAFASSPPISETSPATTAPTATSSPFQPTPIAKGPPPPASALQTKPRPRPVSDGFYPRRTPEPVVRFHDPVVVDIPFRRLSTPVRPSAPVRLISPVKLNPLRPREQMSDDETNYSASEASYASDQASLSANGTSKRLRRRRAPRKSTAFIFAHPAPKLATKKHLLQHIRPTLLLQMQQLSDRRPLPVIDVYPASLMGGNVVAPRFSKLPRLFGVNGELGLHDTILVRNGDYGDQSPGSESECDDDAFERRQLLAVLSPLRREDRSEIVLEDGTVWTAIPLASGSFDFVCVDASGRATTARWVRRTTRADPGTDTSQLEAEKLTFSVINPDSRRHPILATLTKSSLDVLDHYTTVSASSGRYPPTRSRTISPAPVEADGSNDEEAHGDHETHGRFGSATQLANEGRTTHPVDGALRDFICITAIWVALQIGWAQGSTPPAFLSALNNASVTTEHLINGAARAASGSYRRRSFPPKLEESRADGAATNGSGNGDMRGRGLLSLRKSRPASPLVFGQRLDRDDSPYASHRASMPAGGLPTKAFSTGAAYMQRRKQLQQMYDTSDSERPSLSGVQRSRAFSRLSGDYTPDALAKQRLSPSPSIAEFQSTDASPPLSTIYPLSSVTAAGVGSLASRSLSPSTPMPRGGRRNYSAYYPTDTMPTTDFGKAERRTLGYAGESDRGLRPSLAVDKGPSTKWKKLGSWLKKLGGH